MSNTHAYYQQLREVRKKQRSRLFTEMFVAVGFCLMLLAPMLFTVDLLCTLLGITGTLWLSMLGFFVMLASIMLMFVVPFVMGWYE